MGQIKNIKLHIVTDIKSTQLRRLIMERFIILIFVLINVTHLIAADLGVFRCNGTDNGCCTWQNQCDLGDGDCDGHYQCKGLLRCGSNNCGGPPFDPEDDCCELPPDPCLTNNGGCAHICTNDVGLARCSCRPGFQPLGGGRVCDTMNPNPCLVKNGGCGHICKDDKGSPKCSCKEGYALKPDEKTCVALDIRVEGKIQYQSVVKDYCTSVTKKECQNIAKVRGLAYGNISNPHTNAFPSGCYHQKAKNKIYYNSKFSRQKCSKDRMCICETAANVAKEKEE